MSRIEINEARCKGCLLCTTQCPKDLLVQSNNINKQGYKVVSMLAGKESECTACTSCALICPDLAITVYKSAK